MCSRLKSFLNHFKLRLKILTFLPQSLYQSPSRVRTSKYPFTNICELARPSLIQTLVKIGNKLGKICKDLLKCKNTCLNYKKKMHFSWPISSKKSEVRSEHKVCFWDSLRHTMGF